MPNLTQKGNESSEPTIDFSGAIRSFLTRVLGCPAGSDRN